jgi:hypothetical protein
MATASRVRDWLLVEQPGPWGTDALLESRFPKAVARELGRRARDRGIRVVLLRGGAPPDAAGDTARRRVYLAHTGLMALSPRAFAHGVAAILLAAGAFQLSPLKQACLRACRSPLGFLLGHWRAGLRGSLALGWAHALFCLGCCWALMVVLVAAGAMGLAWVLLIAAVVAAEKLLPRGEWIARATGGALLLLGAAVALRPALVTALRAGHAM